MLPARWNLVFDRGSRSCGKAAQAVAEPALIQRRNLLIAAPFLAVASALPSALALAQDSKPGRVTGRAFHPLPQRAMIEVSPLDDRDENLRIAAALREALLRGGYALGDASTPLRLSFDSEVRPLSGPVRAPGTPAPTGSDDVVPGDRGTSPIPERRIQRGSDNVPRGKTPLLRYVLNATIDDRTTGKRMWQGNVRYDDAESDRTQMLMRLVPPLMTAFGQTQKGRSFALE
jgi:hypothetical protein